MEEYLLNFDVERGSKSYPSSPNRPQNSWRRTPRRDLPNAGTAKSSNAANSISFSTSAMGHQSVELAAPSPPTITSEALHGYPAHFQEEEVDENEKNENDKNDLTGPSSSVDKNDLTEPSSSVDKNANTDIVGKKNVIGSPSSYRTHVDELAVQGYEMCAITITGEALTYALANEENRKYFYGLAHLCNTVIACRVTPKQKSEVIRQCKRYHSGMVSLGIGDGANDVGMLITANVGVGISGKEGLQAVRASDFAVGEFRFVKNLMFFHGKEALRRNAFQIYHTIWKNVMFGAADFFYAFVSVFSATDIFNPWIKQLFNVLYTTLPVMLYSIFDRQLPYEILLHTPALYPSFSKMGHLMYAGTRVFWKWFVFGLYTSCVLVMFPLFGLSLTSNRSDGIIAIGLPAYGSTVFWGIVLVCNFIILPYVHTWFWFLWVAMLLNIVFWYLTWYVCPFLPGNLFCPELTGTIEACHEVANYHWSLLLSVVVALLPQLIVWFSKYLLFPSAPVVIRERIAKGVFDVVVAPKAGHHLTVVVPKKDSNEWRGFAFAEQEQTRWLYHKRVSTLRRMPTSSTRVPKSKGFINSETNIYSGQKRSAMNAEIDED